MLLASKLAGPVIRGATGMQVAKGCISAYANFLDIAKGSDSQQRQVKAQREQQVAWVGVR